MQSLLATISLLFLLSVLLSAQNALQLSNQTYIEVPADSSLNPREAITVEAWIKVDSLPSFQTGIVGTWDDNNGAFRTWALWFVGANLQFLFSRNNSESPRTRGDLPALNEWVHIAGTYDGTQAKFYIGDSLYDTNNSGGTLATNNRPLFIGKTETGNNGPDYFNGAIEELRIWNTARSLEQIVSTMDDTLSENYYQTADSGLVAYYRFDTFEDLGVGEDGADDIRDYSINQHHGDLVGDKDSTNFQLPTAIPTAAQNTAEDFVLYQNYPNPFNPSTTIAYQLPKTSRVKLIIFNMLGQEVSTLISGTQSAGLHRLEFNAAGIASGVYYYRLSTDIGFAATKKLLILK